MAAAAARAGPGRFLGIWLRTTGPRKDSKGVGKCPGPCTEVQVQAAGLLLYRTLQSTKKKAQVTEWSFFFSMAI